MYGQSLSLSEITRHLVMGNPEMVESALSIRLVSQGGTTILHDDLEKATLVGVRRQSA